MKSFSLVQLLMDARLFMAGSIYSDESSFIKRDLLLAAIPSIQKEISENISVVTAPDQDHTMSRHDDYVLQSLEAYFKLFFGREASIENVLAFERNIKDDGSGIYIYEEDGSGFYSYQGVIADSVLERALWVDVVARLLYDPIYARFRSENTKNGIISIKTSEVVEFSTGIHVENVKKINAAKAADMGNNTDQGQAPSA